MKYEAIKEEELEVFHLYKKFLDNSCDSFQVAKEDGFLVFVNNFGLKQLGITKEKVATTHVCDFEDNIKTLDDWHIHVSKLKQLKSMTFESSNTNLTTGERFPVELTISYETIDQVGYIIANARDISRRKEAETQLEQTQHLNANVLESMNDGFSMLDLEGNHLLVNTALCTMLGYEDYELIGTGVPHKYWPEAHLDEIQEAFKYIISGEKKEFQLKFKRKNGEIFPVIVSPSQVLNNKGEVISYIATVKDISDLELAQNLVLMSEQRLKVILESSQLGIWDFDLQTQRTIRTLEHDRCFGFNTYQPDWNYELFLSCIHPDDREFVANTYQQALSEQSYYNVDYRVIWSDGSIHWLNSAGKLIYNQLGDPERIIGIVQDISDRKEKEMLLKRSMQEKDSLVAEVHHRVKNNLAVIAGLMYLQIKDTFNEEVIDRLTTNMDRIKSIATIHEELYRSQNFSKISFEKFIRKQVELLQQNRFRQNNVDVVFNLQPLFLDINQALPFALIVNELVSNSFKHAFDNVKNPKIWITLCETESHIELTIQDNGCGIFEQIEPNSSLSMGLNLVETLSKQIDAKTECVSENGFKCTISFKSSF